MVFLQGFPKKIAFLQKVLKHVFSGLGRPWVFMCGIILFSSSSTPTPDSDSSFIFHLVQKFSLKSQNETQFWPLQGLFWKNPKNRFKIAHRRSKINFCKKKLIPLFYFCVCASIFREKAHLEALKPKVFSFKAIFLADAQSKIFSKFHIPFLEQE